MNIFSIRPYCEESDFDIIYDFQCDYDAKTVAYQLSGASPYIPKKRFRRILQKASKYSRFPFVIADDQDRPIGISMVEQYVRVGKHHTFQIFLWEHKELTEEILRRTLRNIFSSSTVKMAICRVTGNEHALVNACRTLGMEEVGCIPEYYCFEGILYPEYTFISRKFSIIEESKA